MLACRDMRAAATKMSRHRELYGALAMAWLLVIARSVVYAAFEQAHFDSDQAIVGLMAKHLSEGRAFPLFFYGQSFMLGVESWLAVPIFWIAGPTVAALRTSLILTNLGVVTLLIIGLVRWGGLRPFHALVASSFFAFAPPVTAARLVEAQGGNVEPFLWVVVLWWLRDRPAWFGAVLGIGFLNREFTIYAVPALVTGQVWNRTFFRSDTLRAWLLAAVTFFFVWQGVQALEPFADLAGPGTRGQLLGGFAGSQVGNLANRMNVHLTEVPARLAAVLAGLLPRLVGGRTLDDVIAVQGRDWMIWPMGLAALAAMARIAQLSFGARSDRRLAPEEAAFAFYVLAIGAIAVVAYAVSRPLDEGTVRYMLLGLFVPIGLVAVWLALEPRAVARQAIVAGVVAWMALSGVDNFRQAARFVRGAGQPNPMREVADALVARRLTIAEATYWRAYKLTFLTEERVKVASTDVARITEYQTLANQAGPGLTRVQDQPCAGEQPVAGWYLCAGR